MTPLLKSLVTALCLYHKRAKEKFEILRIRSNLLKYYLIYNIYL